MQVIAQFDPSISSTGNMDVSAANPGSKLLLYNLSLVTILLNFDNGQTALLHAGEANFWELDGTVPTIYWTQYNVLNSSSPPVSRITATLYDFSEKITGNYPVYFGYSFNIGNSVPVMTSGTVEFVENDSSTAGTVFIGAIVTGDTTRAIYATVDGQLFIGNSNYPGSLTLLGPASVSGGLTMHGSTITLDNSKPITMLDNASSPHSVLYISNQNKVVLGAAGQFIELRDASNGLHFQFDMVNNVLLIPGSFSIVGPSSAPVLTTSIVNTFLNGSNSSVLQANGNNILVAKVDGVNCIQKLNLPINGSMSSLSVFSGTGSGTFSHGLGAIPDVVLPMCSASGSTQTMGYDQATLNSTNVAITTGAGLAWHALAIKQ